MFNKIFIVLNLLMLPLVALGFQFNYGSAQFNGSNQWFSIADSTDISITGDLSLIAWTNPFSLLPDPNRNHILTRWADAGAEKSWQFAISSSRLYFVVRNAAGSEESYDIAYTVPTNQWTHYAVTWKAASSLAIFYINTIEVGRVTGTLTDIKDATSDLEMGRYTNGSYHTGFIDDVQVWAVVRTPEQIKESFCQEINTTSNDLRGYWKLNNVSGNALVDSSISSIADTLTNNNSITFPQDAGMNISERCKNNNSGKTWNTF